MQEDKRQLGAVETITENGIATITFSHPSHNSLPGRLLKKLVDSIDSAGADEAVRVVILKSGGDRTFCAGASFDELITIENLEAGKTFFMGFANVINALRKCPKFVIGRVQGKAVGGGVGLASAVDYCFATKFSAIKLSEMSLGIGPFVIGPAVERKIGISAMSQLAIDATSFRTPEWAREKGLYADVFDSAEQMDLAIEELATKLATSSSKAMDQIKASLWENCTHWDALLEERAAMSGKLILGEFAEDYIAQFKTKA